MKYLPIIQIIVALLLITAIFLQARGTGLSGIFGGEGAVFRVKRGIEKSLFIATITLAIFFFVVALVNVIF